MRKNQKIVVVREWSIQNKDTIVAYFVHNTTQRYTAQRTLATDFGDPYLNICDTLEY